MNRDLVTVDDILSQTAQELGARGFTTTTLAKRDLK